MFMTTNDAYICVKHKNALKSKTFKMKTEKNI